MGLEKGGDERNEIQVSHSCPCVFLGSVGSLPSAHSDPATLHPRGLVKFKIPSNDSVSSSLQMGRALCPSLSGQLGKKGSWSLSQSDPDTRILVTIRELGN